MKAFIALLKVIGAVMAIGCGGCALIPLAAVGTAVDIAGTVATTGPAVYSYGKLDTVLMANDTSVQAAVRRAASDLGFHIIRDHSGGKCYPDDWFFRLQDDLKSKIDVTVERRTPMLCRCRIDVGWFGSEPTAKLILQRIKSHLRQRRRDQPLHILHPDKSKSPR